MPIKDTAKYILGILLAAALMTWVLRDTDPKVLWQQLRAASVPLLLLGASLNIAHNLFRVLRWRVLLAPTKAGLPLRGLLVAVMIGYMTSWVVPGRLGELVRPMLVSARQGVELGPAVGSVVADRLLDIVSVALLFGLGIWITPLSGAAAEHAAALRAGAVLLSIAGVAILAVMIAVAIAGPRLEGWVSRRHRWIRWFGRVALSTARGAIALRKPSALLLSVFYGLIAWLFIAAGTFACVVGSGAEITPGVILVVMPMLVLGVAVPTPGGAGSYHGAMRAGLMLFGVSQVTAVTAGLLTHVMITVPVIIVGMILLWTDNVKWSDLLNGARQLRHLGGDAERTAEGVS